MRILLASLLACHVMQAAVLEVRVKACVAGDACWVEYTVSNPGTGPLRLPDPKFDGDHAPVFFVNGKAAPGGRAIPVSTVTVAPGGKVDNAFRLDMQVPLRPGAYEVRAVLELGGQEVASKSVRLTVTPLAQTAWRITPYPLTDPDRIIASGLVNGQFVQQRLTVSMLDGSVEREGSAVHAAVPRSATELTSALADVHTGEATPLEWIFWRDGARVFGKGPGGLMEPPHVDLPAAGAVLIEQPLMGAKHRADAFYVTGGSVGRRLTVARFVDASATPGEKTRILVNAVPLPAGTVTLALDGAALRRDLRHVLAVAGGSNQLVVHHATLDAAGVLSPFRRVTFALPVAVAAMADSAARGYVGKDGAVHVAVAAVQNGSRRKVVWIDAELGGKEPTVRQFDVESDVVESRAGMAGVAAWWLANGRVAVASEVKGPLRTVTPPPQAMHEILRLSESLFMMTVGGNGLSLVPLPRTSP